MSAQEPHTLLELLKSRRSIRRFRDEDLPSGAEDQLREALLAAPTGGNAQPWHFVFVRSAELRSGLAAAALSQQHVARAPVVVVVSVDLHRARRAYGERGESLYAIQDTAAAVQNLLLMAHALGLGTCWVGAFEEARVHRLLGLEQHLRPVALVPVGIPDESPAPPGRRPSREVFEDR
jgi:nitroreductase